MRAPGSSETLMAVYQTTRDRVKEYHILILLEYQQLEYIASHDIFKFRVESRIVKNWEGSDRDLVEVLWAFARRD
jgi:hypothetical protein